jgi:hypothetical protein
MSMQIPVTSLYPLCECLIAKVTDLSDPELSSFGLLLLTPTRASRLEISQYVRIHCSTCHHLVLNGDYTTELVSVCLHAHRVSTFTLDL